MGVTSRAAEAKALVLLTIALGCCGAPDRSAQSYYMTSGVAWYGAIVATAGLVIFSKVDRGHPTTTEFTLDGVAVGKRSF